MPTYQSAIANNLAPDQPVILDADYQFTDQDRAYIDDQIRATQQAVADNVLNGIHSTWCLLDSSSAAGLAGQVVCAAGTSPQSVTLATPAALAAASSALGVLMQAAAPGGRARIALAGLVPASVTKLAVGASFARVNASTYFPEGVNSLGSGDFPLGTLAANGDLTLAPLMLGVAGGSGGGGSPTIARIGVGGSGNSYATLATLKTVVLSNNASNATTVTTSTAPPDGAELEISDSATGGGSFGTHACSLTAGAGTTIEEPASPGNYTGSAISLAVPASTWRWRYMLTETRWKFLG